MADDRNMYSASLETLNFDNLALRALPVDVERKNYVRQVSGACFSNASPTPVENPQLVVYSAHAMARLLDLPESELKRPDVAEYFSGNRLLRGSQTAAHCYCGHQQGYFSGQLGDGAVIYLGEVINSKGERWELQLKGAGLTPFSNHRDGRKSLRSSIREILCSEAMHYLGIPTVRAGCCVTSDTMILRNVNHDGNLLREKASLILRIAPTFLRIGSFEIFKPRDPITGYQGPSAGRTDILHQLLDYTIKTFFPQIVKEAHDPPGVDCYLVFYQEVVKLSAKVVAEWQCVGFCHGVFNTDNTSILGLTMDYGPCAFMDYYDPDYSSQQADTRRRNTFRRQPEICKWNLMKLAEAIQDALPLQQSLAALEQLFDVEFEECYMKKMRLKLGLLQIKLPEDRGLVDSLLDTMHKTGADFTNTFRSLCRVPLVTEESEQSVLDSLVSQCQSVEEAISSCKPVLGSSQVLENIRTMWASSPSVITHLETEISIHDQHNELIAERLRKLKNLKSDEKEENDRKLWAAWLSRYRSRLAQETDKIDDSSTNKVNEERVKQMKDNNPRFVLRSYIAQAAIEAAEKGDFSEVERVLNLLKRPYSDDPDAVAVNITGNTAKGNKMNLFYSFSPDCVDYDVKPPSGFQNMKLT